MLATQWYRASLQKTSTFRSWRFFMLAAEQPISFIILRLLLMIMRAPFI